MAYMRGHFYVYSDGTFLHIHHGWDHSSDPDCPYEDDSDISHVSIPMEVFDALCAMRWARLTPEERGLAAKKAVDLGAGNFGADALLEELGLPTAMDWVREATKDLESVMKTRADEAQT